MSADEDFPISEYDGRNADDVIVEVGKLVTDNDLDAVEAHEKANKKRVTVLDAVAARREAIAAPPAEPFEVSFFRSTGDRLLASEGETSSLPEIAGALHGESNEATFTIREVIERVQAWRDGDDKTNEINEAATVES